MSADHHVELIRQTLAKSESFATYADQARAVGVSYSTFYRWVRAEQGKREFPVPLERETVAALVRFLEAPDSESAAARLRKLAVDLRRQAEEAERVAAMIERG